jgi:hypothetical protein
MDVEEDEGILKLVCKSGKTFEVKRQFTKLCALAEKAMDDNPDDT